MATSYTGALSSTWPSRAGKQCTARIAFRLYTSMALIDCPECGDSVSSFASACPHCGYPVSEALQEALDEVAGLDKARQVRHLAAAHKLEEWAEEAASPQRKRTVTERTTRVIIGFVVVAVVILELVWVYSAVIR